LIEGPWTENFTGNLDGNLISAPNSQIDFGIKSSERFKIKMSEPSANSKAISKSNLNKRKSREKTAQLMNTASTGKNKNLNPGSGGKTEKSADYKKSRQF